ncbi:MAG: penicillin-binding transpeptidase domain-containing protein [Erysipelotrichaceae bacterium]|nr:penicillin-binding transpeptidase domain-containing protein [Erysipelotrichaceae bacterium]
MKQTHENHRSNARRRIQSAQVLCVVTPLLLCAVFGGKYVVMPYVNDTYKATKNQITYQEISSYVKEGDILDRNGSLIFGNAEAGEGGTASDPENYSYAWLLGYYTVNSSQENSYGLRGSLKDALLYHLDSNDKGETVTLTTDTGLQDYAYQLLDGQEGSITVIDNRTGAILALTSQSTIDYDVNDPDSFLANTTQDGQYRRGTYETDPPGSTFKVVTTAAALKKQEDEGLSDDFFQYTDTGTYTPEGDDWTITNYNNEVYGDIDLDTAFANSVNCYFANLGIQTGADNLRTMAENFMIGKDIEIPFLCTLHSQLDIEDDKPATIAQTAFGQGNTEITPVHLALIAQAVANDGVMMSPYIVQKIDGSLFTSYQARQKKLSAAIDETVDARLKEAMHEAALSYGFSESRYGMVYAKTGTAECPNDRVHCYMIGFTDNYSFCVSFNSMASSVQLYPQALALVNYLNTNM